jgi:hypothetical protein
MTDYDRMEKAQELLNELEELLKDYGDIGSVSARISDIRINLGKQMGTMRMRYQTKDYLVWDNVKRDYYPPEACGPGGILQDQTSGGSLG